MLPPIRPSPITPICILRSLLMTRRYSSAASIACDSSVKACIDMLKVNAQRTTIAFHQHREVTAWPARP